MRMQQVHPENLQVNPWNTNRLSPEAEIKLSASIERLGMFKPIVVRELHDGVLQILGGQHRAEQATRLGMSEIPAVNLGLIGDDEAKQIGILDNARYGVDDSEALAKLLESLGAHEDLVSFMPFDMDELEAITAVSKINLDTLEIEDEDTSVPEKAPREVKTHTVMRFRVPLEDQQTIENLIKSIIKDQEITDSDSMVRAGDALTWLARAWSTRNTDGSK